MEKQRLKLWLSRDGYIYGYYNLHIRKNKRKPRPNDNGGYTNCEITFCSSVWEELAGMIIKPGECIPIERILYENGNFKFRKV